MIELVVEPKLEFYPLSDVRVKACRSSSPISCSIEDQSISRNGLAVLHVPAVTSGWKGYLEIEDERPDGSVWDSGVGFSGPLLPSRFHYQQPMIAGFHFQPVVFTRAGYETWLSLDPDGSGSFDPGRAYLYFHLFDCHREAARDAIVTTTLADEQSVISYSDPLPTATLQKTSAYGDVFVSFVRTNQGGSYSFTVDGVDGEVARGELLVTDGAYARIIALPLTTSEASAR